MLVGEAERLGVVIALGTNGDFLATGTDGLAFVDERDSPWFGVNYDARTSIVPVWRRRTWWPTSPRWCSRCGTCT